MSAVTSPVVPRLGVATDAIRPASSGHLRLAALALLGVSLGAIGSILTVNWVQAEGGMDMLANARNDHQRREAARRPYYPTSAAPVPVPRASYTGLAPRQYAPSAPAQPLSRTNDRGQLTLPFVDLNPFNPSSADGRPRSAAPRKPKVQAVAKRNRDGNTVSGAADSARSICVRMCDGFHAPLGYLASASDMPAHEALCKAMNPGVPVQVFRVPAGATTIDSAIASNGKSYGALTVAYSHEKTADPACRPKIVGFKERRVSVLKDFTLRPGDTVVTETGARVFNGGSRYPFAGTDFSDFRHSDLISASERQRIDNLVGATRSEQARRQAQNALRLQQASAAGPTAFDGVYELRGSIGNLSAQDSPRIVMPSPFSSAQR